jgi:hypothetical protein
VTARAAVALIAAIPAPYGLTSSRLLPITRT